MKVPDNVLIVQNFWLQSTQKNADYLSNTKKLNWEQRQIMSQKTRSELCQNILRKHSLLKIVIFTFLNYYYFPVHGLEAKNTPSCFYELMLNQHLLPLLFITAQFSWVSLPYTYLSITHCGSAGTNTTPSVRFFNLGITDILDWTVLCFEVWPVL